MPSRKKSSHLPQKHSNNSNNNPKDTVAKTASLPESENVLDSYDVLHMSGTETILYEDGLIVESKNRVVAKNSKVNTAFAGQFASSKTQPTTDLGGKKSLSLHDLRKRFGFSWQRFSQRFGLFFLMFGVVFLVGISLVGTWVVDQWNSAPDPDQILNGNANQSSVVLARDGKTELFKFFDKENREIVNLMEPDQIPDGWNAELQNYIPRKMQLAMVALEDENFYRNDDGIPWSNLLGASVKCLTSALSDCRGASGISQQLVKNVTADDDSTVDRKVRELFTALKLGNNENYDKERILNLYLNTVGFGRNAHGVQAASQSYFGKDIKDIQMHEACFLASLPQDPVIYNNALSNPESEMYTQLMIRKDLCLQKLSGVEIRIEMPKYLTQQEVEEMKKLPLTLINFRRDRKFPHFLDFVEQELQDKKLLAQTPQATQDALATGGYKIITTIDPALQGTIEEIFAKNYDRSIAGSGANNASGVVLDGPTGQIVAMVGSIDYNNKEIDGQVNIATSPQAPGSSFKPYVYAAALEKNFNPSTVFSDVRTDFGGGYAPNNFDKRFRGPVTMRYALQSSLNIPAIKALYLASGAGNYSNGEQGVSEVLRVSEALGVRFPFRDNCMVSMALGSCEVSLLSHTTGMNTLGQSGRLRTATPFLSILKVDEDGRERDIYKERMEGEKNQVPYPQNDRVIDPAIANQMADVMSDYEARIDAFGSLRRLLEVDGWRVAAKTGTSTLSLNGREYASDLWVSGFSPLYSTVIWVGNTRNEPVSDFATGSGSSAIIWKDIMEHLHAGKPRVDFSKEGLQRYQVNCSAGRYCSGTEWLTPGQYQALTRFGSRVVDKAYDPLKNSIFDFRDEVFFRVMKVHKADKKVPKEGTPENLLEEIRCVEAPSAFPLTGAWLNPVQDDASRRFANQKCPTEQSGYDATNADLTITSNLDSSASAPVQIAASAASGYPGVTITRISIIIDGVEVLAANSNSLVYDATNQSGLSSVSIKAEDSLGNTKTVDYTAVNFNFSELSNANIASLTPNCSPNPVTAGASVNCNFIIPNGKFISSNFKMFIGSNVVGGVCSVFGSTVTCNGIPTTGVLPGASIAIRGGVISASSGTFAGTIEIK